MTIQATTLSTQPRRLWRSTAAVLLGFVAVVVLSLGTDQVLHALKVYPPWGQPLYDPRLNLLALAIGAFTPSLVATSLPGSRLAIRCVTLSS